MENIRNFSIIAHIDHGKTTLTDRLLHATNTISSLGFHDRLLDSNPIEQERGITIKLAPVRMCYDLNGHTYTLNLIDTPGHVDFSYEVSRSLSACEGAVLVVDATKGIQAQTIANYDKAKAHNLTIIPVVNKIDLPNAVPDKVAQDMVETFGYRLEDIIFVSAKTGENVKEILAAIIERVPPPKTENTSHLKALVFNSVFHSHKGVIAFIRVVSGRIAREDLENLELFSTHTPVSAQEIGVFNPEMIKVDILEAGNVGYVATGLKSLHEITIGDTLTLKGSAIEPIPGYQKPQPMVFMDMYPLEADEYLDLSRALEKLSINDSSLTYRPVASPALGNGFRVGFLGVLHAEIVQERLSREFEMDVMNTSPSVPYQLTLKTGEVLEVSSPADFPDPSLITEIKEPIVDLTIYTPQEYIGAVMELCEVKRGEFVDMQYVSEKVKLSYLMPLVELITNFYDRLKSASAGYASVQYETTGYAPLSAVKVDILISGKIVEALSFISPQSQADQKGRALAEALKKAIPRQQFEVPIQAAVGGKIITRETIKAFRKDVTAKLYGGDRTRRMKLLEKQKKGKKRMKQIGNIIIPQEAFTEVLKI